MFVEVDENSAVPPGNLFVKAENKVLGARNPLAPHQVRIPAPSQQIYCRVRLYEAGVGDGAGAGRTLGRKPLFF